MTLLEQLERRLASRTRLSLIRPRGAAAVLLPLVGAAGSGSLSLLFTRRSTSIPQGGQVAFPGGRVDEADADRQSAAIREAEEEVGLPRSAVRVLGLLDDVPNLDNSVSVTPVVAHVAESFDVGRLVAQPSEVASIFTVPLSHLSDDARWTTRQHSWQGMHVTQFYYDVSSYDGAGEGEDLWGLSAYCALGLCLQLPGGGGLSPGIAQKHGTLRHQYERRLKEGLRTAQHLGVSYTERCD